MKTCKVYKVMVYARWISHMNQNDGFSRKLDSIKCTNLKKSKSEKNNTQVRETIQVSQLEKRVCTNIYTYFPLCFVLVLWNLHLEAFEGTEIRAILSLVWKTLQKNMKIFRKNEFWILWFWYLFGDPKFIKWIMPNPLQFFCVEGEVCKMNVLLWIPTLRQKGGSL